MVSHVRNIAEILNNLLLIIVMLDRLLLLCEKYPLDFIAYISSSLPIILGLLRYRFLSKSSKLIVTFFVFYFLIEAFATWLALLRKNNLYLQNVEIIPEIVIILFISFVNFQNKTWKIIAVILAIICLTISFITYKNDAVSSVNLSAFRLFAIFFCLTYFSKILVEVRVRNILLHTMFWFASGLLIYSTGTFFIMLFSEYWYKGIDKVSAELFDKYWNPSQVLFVIFCIFSSIGLWFSKYDKENFI